VRDADTWPIVTAAVTCLTEQLVRAQVPMPGFVGVLPGAVAVQDWAANCGGQAWVRLGTMYPSTAFPTADTGVNQFTGLRAFTLEVGITRCTPGFDAPDGALPSVAEEQETARVQLADMDVLYRTLACCLTGRRAVLGSYTPLGQDLGYVGGMWVATVEAG
jgi:hypothetical protein